MKKKKLTEIEKKINNFIIPNINYSYQRTVSYSQFSIYQQCPHRWNLEYVQKHKLNKPNINLVFGTAFHETLQTYLETLYNTSRVAANKIDLEALFQERFRAIYQKEYEGTKSHFTNPTEMREFYEDGIAILQWIKKKSGGLFSIKNVRLLGIELPLLIKIANNIYYKAFIDFALYDEDLKKLYIYDIKTSTRGWSNYEKKDETKVAQILLYKEFFARQYGFDVEQIDVEFFIVKRKIYEQSEYPIPRVQEFKPASGKSKRRQAIEKFESFVKDCFDEGGKPRIKSYIKNVGESSCKWCPFADKPELCDKVAVSA